MKNIALVDHVLNVEIEYNHLGKEKFHRLGKKYLMEVAKKLKLDPKSYSIRSNKAGPAVSGEITLHGEWIYIQFSKGYNSREFMYRQCHGQKDYTGEFNRWMQWTKLNDITDTVRVFRELMPLDQQIKYSSDAVLV